MGYGHQHCSLAWPASKIKGDPEGYEREQCSLLGDAFSMYSFCIIGAALCKAFLPSIHYRHLSLRMGLAPGFRASLRLQAPPGSFLIDRPPPPYWRQGPQPDPT